MDRYTKAVLAVIAALSLSGCQKTVNETLSLVPGVNLKYNSAAVEGSLSDMEVTAVRDVRDPSSCAIDALDAGSFANFSGRQELRTALISWRDYGTEAYDIVTVQLQDLRQRLQAKTRSGDHDIIEGTALYDEVDIALERLRAFEENSNHEAKKKGLETLLKPIYETQSEKEADRKFFDCFSGPLARRSQEVEASNEQRREDMQKWLDRAEKVYDAYQKVK